jgi:hypothetical protein
VTTDVFAEVQRDRFGRPLIVPPSGGKPTAYTRCTTYAGALEDTYALGKWQQRMVAVGLSQRSDLLLAAGAHRDDKDRLDDVCDQAREAAGAGAAATTGTALHKLCERLDLGQPIGAVPAEHDPDIKAYHAATAGIEHEHVEQLMVCDELKVAGTPDRIAVLNGKLTIFDIKTGSIDYAMNKIAMQLAVYSRSALYNPATGERTVLALDQDEAIVAHLPAGKGVCTLYTVDIARGWRGVQLAREVRGWRAVKSLARPLLPAPARTFHDRILAAAAVDDLAAIWREAKAAGAWNDELTKTAAQRKSQLTRGDS